MELRRISQSKRGSELGLRNSQKEQSYCVIRIGLILWKNHFHFKVRFVTSIRHVINDTISLYYTKSICEVPSMFSVGIVVSRLLYKYLQFSFAHNID